MTGAEAGSEREVIRLLEQLVAIPSVSPDLPGGTDGEAEIVDHLTTLLKSEGVFFEFQEVLPGRRNIIASIPGKQRDRAILFESHLDTASVLNMNIPPYDPIVKDGRLFGRGSCDTKGTVASMLSAFLRIHRSENPPPQTVFWAGVVDEEYCMRGSVALSKWIVEQQSAGVEFLGAIVGEPTELEVVIAHKGAIHGEVQITGKAAHGSTPERGRNAALMAAQVALALDNEYASQIRSNGHPLTGAATINVGRIAGGIQSNVVPAKCSLLLDRRTVPGEKNEDAFNGLKEFLEATVSAHQGYGIEILQPSNWCEAVSTAESAPIVQEFLSVRNKLLGSAQARGVMYATDASKLTGLGIPLIVFGPGNIAQAHTEDEFIELEQLHLAVEMIEKLMLTAM